MKRAILGYTGFVGGHLVERYPGADLYDSKNLSNIAGKDYDEIYCACIPSVKWYANKNPEDDLATIQQIKTHLNQIGACTRFILISTIDIHDHSIINQTEVDITPSTESYGKNRYEFELWVQQWFNNVYIVRLPALFGIGIKKNALYDLLNNRLLEKINIYDMFQWYDLRWLVDDINDMIMKSIHVLHVYSSPILMKTIIDHFFPQITNNLSCNQDKVVVYNHKSIHSYSRSEAEILCAMENFINVYKFQGHHKLAISNLHWDCSNLYDKSIPIILGRYGVKKVELAISKYIKWEDPELFTTIKALADWFNKHGIEIYSFQSILYGINGTLSANYDAIYSRMKKVILLADHIGVKRLVFGSPNMRGKPCVEEDLYKLFNDLSEYMSSYPNISLCLEPNSRVYGCVIGVNFVDVLNIVQSINNPNLMINYDTGNALLENDTPPIPPQESYIKHIQVSMPYLKDFDNTTLNEMLKKYPFIYGHKSVITLEINSSLTKVGDNLYTFMACYKKNQPHKPKILVLGTGWYGCHTAETLNKKGYDYDIADKVDDIMVASSVKNQNRLHLGFHYPRSYETRIECIEGYDKFLIDYGKEFVRPILNYYIISKESRTPFHQFISIYDNSHYELTSECPPFNIQKQYVQEDFILTKELFINPSIVSKSFKSRLMDKLIPYKTINFSHYDYIFDCTYGQSNIIPRQEDMFIFELCLTLIYRMKVSSTPIAVTIMDGNFFSIYPYDINQNLYTLTHVKYTPVLASHDINEIYEYDKRFVERSNTIVQEIRKKMELSVHDYILNFNDMFEYHSYFTSIKKKVINNQSDDRSMKYEKYGKVHSFWGGKITGIFKINEIIDKVLCE